VAKSRRVPDDDEDDDDAPRRKKRDDDDDDDDGPIKPRKKKKSAAGPTKIVLRIIGGVIGSIALFILLWWVYKPVGTDSSMLCYFPKETTGLQGYDVEEGMKNAKLKDVHETLMNNYRQFGNKHWTEASGVKDTDVVKYLSGTASTTEDETGLDPQDKRGSLTVIRFRKEVDEAKFVASFTGTYQCEEMAGKDGKKLYQLWFKKRVPPDMHEEREDETSFFFPNKTTLVYSNTRRELREAMNKTQGKISVEGDMKTLANEVDGHYFQCNGGWSDQNSSVTTSGAFRLSFLDEEFRDDRRSLGVVGTAMWWASNGNDFLYASAILYGSPQTAREARRKLAAGYEKAQKDIYQSEGNKPGGLTDPWNPQPKTQAPAAPGGFAGPMQSANAEQVKDTVEALSEFAKTARVRSRGPNDRLVIVEGLISHGTPEQGVFEKLWKAIGPKYQTNQGGGMAPMGGMGMPAMGPGGPGGPVPGAPPVGVPGPGR
jgi:hypothetical protein